MATKKQSKSHSLTFEAHKALGVNFAQDLADHSQELLWGQGFNATLTKEQGNKYLQELLEYNKAKEQFAHAEKLLSLFGNIYWTIDIVKGKPTWTIADPYLNSNGLNGRVSPNNVPSITGSIYGMGRALVTDEVAVIWKRITYGTVSFPIKEVWDKQKVKRYFYGENGKIIRLAEVNKKIPEDQQLKEEFVHGMGFVPVVWSKNLPVFNSLSPADGYKGKSIQDMANHILSQAWYETATNRTRLFGAMNQTQYAKLLKDGQLPKMVVQDMLINVPQQNSTGDEVNALVPIQGDPKLETYTKAYQFYKDEYFRLAGYSPLGDGSTEKTATENLLMKTGDYQTTKKKRNQRYAELYSLIKYSLLMDVKFGKGNVYGDIEKDLKFEIMENKVMDSLNEITNLNLMVDNDYMSKVEAIKELRGITLEEAKAAFALILEEKKMYLEADPEPKGDNDEIKSK